MLRNCTRARPVLCKAFYSSSSRRKACQISGHEAAALLFVGGTAVFALTNRVKKRDEAGEPDMINFDLGKFRNMCNGSVQVDRATFFLNGRYVDALLLLFLKKFKKNSHDIAER